jgi:hypothetical protein
MELPNASFPSFLSVKRRLLLNLYTFLQTGHESKTATELLRTILTPLNDLAKA